VKCGLTRTEYRGRIDSLFLLATPFLMQAKMPLAFLATWAHCWLVFSRASINTPGSISSTGQIEAEDKKNLLLVSVAQTKMSKKKQTCQFNNSRRIEKKYRSCFLTGGGWLLACIYTLWHLQHRSYQVCLQPKRISTPGFAQPGHPSHCTMVSQPPTDISCAVTEKQRPITLQAVSCHLSILPVEACEQCIYYTAFHV